MENLRLHGRGLNSDILLTFGQLLASGGAGHSDSEQKSAIGQCLAEIVCCLGNIDPRRVYVGSWEKLPSQLLPSVPPSGAEENRRYSPRRRRAAVLFLSDPLSRAKGHGI